VQECDEDMYQTDSENGGNDSEHQEVETVNDDNNNTTLIHSDGVGMQ